MISPEFYDISITEKTIKGKTIFVGKIKEFPGVEKQGNTYDEVAILLFKWIETTHNYCKNNSIDFPLPNSFCGGSFVTTPEKTHSGRIYGRLYNLCKKLRENKDEA